MAKLMQSAGGKRLVTVKVGHGESVHAKYAEPSEGKTGFYNRHTECGQQRSVKSRLTMLKDSDKVEIKPSDITCGKCREKLGI